MFLLNLGIINKVKKKKNYNDLTKLNLIIKNLNKNVSLKKKKNLFFFKFLIDCVLNKTIKINNIFIKFYLFNFISHLQKQLFFNKIYNYLFKINFLKSNLMVNITDIKGKTIIKNSSGLMHFKNKQKIKVLAINAVFKKIKFKIRKKVNFYFSAHIKGKTKKKVLSNKIKNFLELKSILNFNLIPFNGCRQKKRKRKKRKKLLYIK